MPSAVRDNAKLNRYEMDLDGAIAFIDYRRAPGVLTFTHAEVPPQHAGRGVGSALAQGALELARAGGYKVVPRCPFIAAYLGKHPEFHDLLG